MIHYLKWAFLPLWEKYDIGDFSSYVRPFLLQETAEARKQLDSLIFTNWKSLTGHEQNFLADLLEIIRWNSYLSLPYFYRNRYSFVFRYYNNIQDIPKKPVSPTVVDYALEKGYTNHLPKYSNCWAIRKSSYELRTL